MDGLFAPAEVPASLKAQVNDEEEYESVLFVARECYVYKVPPRSSTSGYKAAEWVSLIGLQYTHKSLLLLGD